MKKIWFPFYLADYEVDTAHLTFEEHGAYLALLRHYYRTGKPLDANASVLHRVCRASARRERDALDRMLQLFFTREGNVYKHTRVDRELLSANEISEKRAKAALKRWDANAMQMHTQSQSQSHIDIKSKSNTFVRPKLEEVNQYGIHIGSSVDPQHFIDYYESNGWMVGRNAMKDWRAAFRTWTKNGFNQPASKRTECNKHPESGLTPTGGCFACYAEAHG